MDNPSGTGPELKPEDIFRPNTQAFIDDTRTWVDPAGYRLSDRLWRSRADDRKQIEQVLRAGVARGASPLETARALEGLLNPYYQPRRDPDTFRVKPLSQQPKGVATKTPRQGPGRGPFRPRNSGTGSYAARRLARTEVTRAFGAATERAAKANPLLEKLKWRLSGHHHDSDQCDMNASRSSQGLPRGVYWVDEVPQFPDHPHEMCTINPHVTMEDIAFNRQRLREYVNTGTLPPRDWAAPDALIPLKRPTAPVVPPTPRTGPSEQPQGPSGDDWMRELADLRRQMDRSGLDMPSTTRARQSLDLVKRAGAIMRPRVYAQMDPADVAMIDRVGKARMALMQAQKKERELAATLKRKKKANPALEAELTDARMARARAESVMGGMNQEAATHFAGRDNPFREATKAAYADFRPIGGADEQRFTGKSSLPKNQPAVDAVKKGAENLPREWMQQSAELGRDDDRGYLQALKEGRGYYSHSGVRADIAISGRTPAGMEDTATHELVHRVEALRKGTMGSAQRAFYDERAGAERPTWLGSPYGRDEKAVRDLFQSTYMGKDYGPYSGHYELATMGIEDLMTAEASLPRYILGDDEYQEFIFGLLAIG